MKNRKRPTILLLVFVCMILSACGQEKEATIPDTEEPHRFPKKKERLLKRPFRGER